MCQGSRTQPAAVLTRLEMIQTLQHRHSGMLLAGLNLPGADLNSQQLVRRMKYMDVFHNPVN